MDTSAFDNKINNLENQFDEKQKEMGDIYNKFIEIIIKESKLWSIHKIEKSIESNYEITLSKNESMLKNLKEECIELINEMPKLVEESFDDDKYWIHRKNLSFLVKSYSENKNYAERIENIIKSRLITIMGRTGVILYKNGYIAHDNSSPEWTRFTDGTLRFDGSFELNVEIKQIIDNYTKKSTELINIVEKIMSVKEDKSKYMALTKWKQIEIE